LGEARVISDIPLWLICAFIMKIWVPGILYRKQ
jgi:hypothetical protein